MDIFLQCRVVEQFGRGVPVVVREYGESAYEFSDDMITVRVPFSKPFSQIKEVTGEITGEIKLTEKEREVLRIMKNNPYVKRDEIIVKSGYSKNMVDDIIRKLKDKPCIERVGSRKSGYWEIV